MHTTPEPDFFHDAARMRGRSLVNRMLTAACVVLSLCALVPLGSLLWLVVKNGLPLFRWEVFTGLPPAPGLTGGGFGNAVIGTLVMVGLGLVMATPPGILAAVYLCEYRAQSWLKPAVRFAAKMLAGIPSIICGVFAYAAVVVVTGRFSAVAGGVALAVLMLPTIVVASEQALLGVPEASREASLGLGATRLQTLFRVVLPDALPGIMTGLILAAARAAGETAPLIFTALFSQFWMTSLMEPTASLSVLVYNFSTMPYEHQVSLAWTASLVLILLVTTSNVAAQWVFGRKQT